MHIEIILSVFFMAFVSQLALTDKLLPIISTVHQHRVHEQKDSKSLAFKLYLVWVLNKIIPNNVIHNISYHSLFPNTGRKRKDRCSHIIVYALYQCFCKVSVNNACCEVFFTINIGKNAFQLIIVCQLTVCQVFFSEFCSMSFLTVCFHDSFPVILLPAGDWIRSL